VINGGYGSLKATGNVIIRDMTYCSRSLVWENVLQQAAFITLQARRSLQRFN